MRLLVANNDTCPVVKEGIFTLDEKILYSHKNKEGCKMGSVNEINCDNCSFSVNTSNNLTMIVCNDNLDYYDELYCLNCQKIVKVWQRKNGKDIVSKCPECGSHDVFLDLPDKIKIKCPKCKKGNLKSKLILLTD